MNMGVKKLIIFLVITTNLSSSLAIAVGENPPLLIRDISAQERDALQQRKWEEEYLETYKALQMGGEETQASKLVRAIHQKAEADSQLTFGEVKREFVQWRSRPLSGPHELRPALDRLVQAGLNPGTSFYAQFTGEATTLKQVLDRGSMRLKAVRPFHVGAVIFCGGMTLLNIYNILKILSVPFIDEQSYLRIVRLLWTVIIFSHAKFTCNYIKTVIALNRDLAGNELILAADRADLSSSEYRMAIAHADESRLNQKPAVEKICPVCHVETAEGLLMIKPECSHELCRDCAMSVLSRDRGENRSCPQCRALLPVSGLVEVFRSIPPQAVATARAKPADVERVAHPVAAAHAHTTAAR